MALNSPQILPFPEVIYVYITVPGPLAAGSHFPHYDKPLKIGFSISLSLYIYIHIHTSVYMNIYKYIYIYT